MRVYTRELKTLVTDSGEPLQAFGVFVVYSSVRGKMYAELGLTGIKKP